MKFKKSFGQVFLRDKRYLSRITRSIKVDGEPIIEIGGGSGVLTRQLLTLTHRLYCIEKDIGLSSLLRERFSSRGAVIINKDILHFDIQGIGEEVVVVGNVPYNISNDLIRYLIVHKSCVKRAYLTLQKEFAKRLVAPKNTKEYGFLGCYLQYYARLSLLFSIPQEAFFPRPKVDSSFIEINFYQKPLYAVNDEDFLFRLIRASFSSRRKKLTNALEDFCSDKSKLQRAFQKAALNPGLRPQNLSLEDYCRLASMFKCA